MDRTRIAFIVIVVIAVTALVGSAYTYVNRPQPFDRQVINKAGQGKSQFGAKPTNTSPVQAKPDPKTAAIVTKDGRQIKPIFGPNYNPDDGLPTYVCGTVASGSYYLLQLIQTAKLDTTHNFHLGLVPYDMNSDYALSEDEVSDMMRKGQMDCLLTTLDTVALHNQGVVTAINAEGAGTDQLWARGAKTLNDLKGKRIVTTQGDSNEYLVHYLLSTVQIDPQKGVKLIYVDTMEDALDVFNKGEADAISGYEPAIQQAQNSGGILLASTRDFRAVVDVIVTARETTNRRATDVMQFHRAWFAALALQASDFDKAAKLIADWGNADYTGIRPDSAALDFREQLQTIAQANLDQNRKAMLNVGLLTGRMDEARRLWHKAGVQVPLIPSEVNPSFVLSIAQDVEKSGLPIAQPMVNNSFSLNQSDLAADKVDRPAESDQPESWGSAIAVLPCSRFEFAPDTTDLLPMSKQALDECVVRTMRESVGLLLRIRGSSAWPGPKGSISQEDVEQVARGRAEAVADYLHKKGIPRGRLRIEAVLPPPEHRETMNKDTQAKDRYVEMALLSGGQ